MSDISEIRLSKISKKFLFRYYPFWLLFAINSAIFLNITKSSPMIETFCRFHLHVFIIYLLIITPLYILKPVNPFVRLIVAVFSMLAAAMAFTALDGFDNGYNPIPFSNSPAATMGFLSCMTSGIYMVWFFFLEEKQYVSEKRISDERARRIFNEKKVVESQLKLLQAQIEPHFLFNTLTSIVSLDDTDPQKAKTMQMNFIQYLKASLAKTRSSITTIAQEIELICAYLDIFKVRMGDRLKYTIDVAYDVKSLAFPSMLIQPIVENAIKHGLEPKVEGGEISILAKKSEQMLRWEIADTGLGLSDKADLGTGLSSIIARIDALYGSKGQVIMEENQPAGLKVIIEVPYAE